MIRPLGFWKNTFFYSFPINLKWSCWFLWQCCSADWMMLCIRICFVVCVCLSVWLWFAKECGCKGLTKPSIMLVPGLSRSKTDFQQASLVQPTALKHSSICCHHSCIKVWSWKKREIKSANLPLKNKTIKMEINHRWPSDHRNPYDKIWTK